MATSTSADAGLVHPGMRVSHDVHGEGIVVSVGAGKQPSVKLSFPGDEFTWQELAGGALPNEENLELSVPLHRFLTGPEFHLPSMSMDAQYELLMEMVSTQGMSQVQFTQTGLQGVEKFLEIIHNTPTRDLPAMVSTIKAVIDWTVAINIQTLSKRQKPQDAAAALRQMDQRAGRDLWAKMLYPRLPEEVREPLDELLVAATRGLYNEDDAGLQDAAARLQDAIECRVFVVHHKRFLQAIQDLEHRARQPRRRPRG